MDPPESAGENAGRVDHGFRRLLENLNEGVWVLDRDGFTTFVNSRMAEMLGERVADMPCRHIFDFMDEKTSHAYNAQLWRHRRGSREEHETRLRRKDGTTITVRMRSSPLTDKTGAFEGLIAGVTDITPYRKAKAQLERERAFIDSLLSTMGGLVIVLDAKGRIVRFNRACERATGYEEREVRGRVFWDFLVLPEERDAVLNTFSQLAGGEFPLFHENAWLARDGRQVRIAWSNTSMTDDDGTVTHVIGTGIDISDRVRAEDKLRRMRDRLAEMVERRTAQLQQAEARYRTVADFTQGWEYWESPEGELLYVSPACERMTGYAAGEFIARPELLHEIIVPGDREMWHSHRDRQLHRADGEIVEFRVRHRDGHTVWLQHTCRSVTDGEGKDLGIRGSNREITAVKRLEEQNAGLRDHLAHVSRVSTMGELTASLAHELNQPLTAIRTNAQAAVRMLGRQDCDVEEIREALEDIVQDDRRADGVIRHVRSLMRREEAHRERLSVDRLLRDIVRLMHSEMIVKGVALDLRVDAPLPPITANPVEIQQICLNLLTNAAEAVEGGCAGEVRVHARAENGGVQVTVADNGPGISEVDLARIFDRFYTTKQSGMGMGLAICRSVAERHGGRLVARNGEDGGAVFTLTLPAGEDS